MTKNDGVEKLWQDYRKTHSPEIREKLVLRYVSLVKYVAGRLAIGLPPSVQADDLISSGVPAVGGRGPAVALGRQARDERVRVRRNETVVLGVRGRPGQLCPRATPSRREPEGEQ